MRLLERVDITKSVVNSINEAYDPKADGYPSIWLKGVDLEKYNTPEKIKTRIKEIGKELAYCNRRDKHCLALDGEEQRYELEAERDALKAKLKGNRKLKEAEEEALDTNSLEQLKEVMRGMLDNATELEKYVIEDQLDEVDGYDSPQTFIEHLCDLCITGGGVSSLIYYDDTLAFCEQFSEEINQLLSEGIFEFGSLQDMFGDRYDDTDPMNLGTTNRNLFAWYAYEETARRIAEAINEAGNYGANI